jgi:hypothetical protein
MGGHGNESLTVRSMSNYGSVLHLVRLVKGTLLYKEQVKLLCLHERTVVIRETAVECQDSAREQEITARS